MLGLPILLKSIMALQVMIGRENAQETDYLWHYRATTAYYFGTGKNSCYIHYRIDVNPSLMGNFSHLRSYCTAGTWVALGDNTWEPYIPHQKCLVRKPEYLFQFFSRKKRQVPPLFFPLRFEEMMWYIEKLLRIELFYVRNYTCNIFFAP